jgi:hypothetical protein
MGKTTLKKLATPAGYLLALYGLASVVVLGIGWITDKLFVSDVAAAVRPICERVLVITDSTLGLEWRMLGANIITVEGFTSGRLRMHGVRHIAYWGIDSDALSPDEQLALKESLPTGPVPGELLTTAPLPSHPSDSRTTLHALAVVDADICYDSDWLEFLAEPGRVYHLDVTSLYARGSIKYMARPWHLWIVLVALFGVGLYVWKRRASKSGP